MTDTWSAKYRRKYMFAIKDKKPVSKEEVWDQVVEDFKIPDDSERHAVFDDSYKHKQLLSWMDAIVANRSNESREQRFVKEYYYRSRILKLFPSSYNRYLLIKRAETDEALKDVPLSENMTEAMQNFGKKISRKKDKAFTALQSIFGDGIERVS